MSSDDRVEVLTQNRSLFSKEQPRDERSDDEDEGEEPELSTAEKLWSLKGEKVE